MCYKYPGPRCTPHALQALRKAQAEYNAKATYEAYVAVRKAQDAYDLTPGGQKALHYAMKNEQDFIKRYELQQRLEHSIEARKIAIETINAKDRGDFHNGEEISLTGAPGITATAPNINNGLPVDPMPKSKIGKLNKRHLSYSFQSDYDDYVCDYRDCGEDGDYCRHSVYINPRVSPVSEREVLATTLGVPEKKVPETMVKALEDFGMMEYVHVETPQGYYGEEIEIKVDNELERFVEDLYYEQPNVDEPNLNYARQEGIDTLGLRPLEAVKKTLNPNHMTDVVRKKVAHARTIKTERIDMKSIIVTRKRPKPTGKYNYAGASLSSHSGGVLTVINGKYHLIGGFDRYDAVKAQGNIYWTFQVMY